MAVLITRKRDGRKQPIVESEFSHFAMTIGISVNKLYEVDRGGEIVHSRFYSAEYIRNGVYDETFRTRLEPK